MDCPECVPVNFSSQNVPKNLINEIWPQKVIEIDVNVFNDVNWNIKHIHIKKISSIEHLKAFMKTSLTHSLSTFWSSRSQQGAGREHTYSKMKQLKQTKACFYSVTLSYPILLENIKKKIHVYAYFQWSHFRRGDSSMLILPIEKYNLMNARIWEINFPWNDGDKNWWSMELCYRLMTDWNQASI